MLVQFLMMQFKGQIGVPDFGFCGRDTHSTLIWWRALSKEKLERRVRDARNEVYDAWRRERALRSGE